MKKLKIKRYLILILLIIITVVLIPIVVKSAPGDPKHQYTGQSYDAFVTDKSQRDSDTNGDGKIEYFSKTDLTYEHNGDPISKEGENPKLGTYDIKQMLDLLNGFPRRTKYPATILYTFPSVFCLKYGTYIQRGDGYLVLDHGSSVNMERLLDWKSGGWGTKPTSSQEVATLWGSLHNNCTRFWSSYHKGVLDYFEDFQTNDSPFRGRWSTELHSGMQNVSGLDIAGDILSSDTLESNVVDNVSEVKRAIEDESIDTAKIADNEDLDGILENNVEDNVGGNAIFDVITRRGNYKHYEWTTKKRYASSNSIFRTYPSGNWNADYRSLEDVSTPYTQTSNGTAKFDVRYTSTFSQKTSTEYLSSSTYGLERTQIAIWKYTDQNLEQIFSQVGDDVENEHTDNEYMDYGGKDNYIREGNALYNVNAAFVDYDNSKKIYNVEVADSTGTTGYGIEVTTFDEANKKTGTTLKSYNPSTKTATYYVGPFKMSNYAYAYAENVEHFSGYDIKENNLGKNNKNLLGGIINGTVTLKNDNGGNDKIIKIGSPEAKITYDVSGSELINNTRQSSVQKIDGSGPVWTYPTDYDYPWPESTFFIELTCSIDYAYIDDISFEYRETTAEGNGWVVESKYFSSRFMIKKNDAEVSTTCSYYPKYYNNKHYCNLHGSHNVSEIKIDLDTSYGYNGHSRSRVGGYHECTYKYYCDDNYYNTQLYYNPGYNVLNPHGSPYQICECDGEHACPGSASSPSGLRWNCEYPGHGSHPCDNYDWDYGYCSHSCGTACEEGCIHSHSSSCVRYYCNGDHYCDKCRCSCDGHEAQHIDYFVCESHDGDKSTCSHGKSGEGHEICIKAYWTYEDTSSARNTSIRELKGQPLLLVHDASVHVESRIYSLKTPIRLTTDISIDKYVYDVSHNIDEKIDANMMGYDAYSYDNTLVATDDRNQDHLTESQKKANPVYAEHGDTVTYKIVFRNYQKQKVKFKAKDILPRQIIKKDNIKTSLTGFSNNSVPVTVRDKNGVLYLATDDFLTLDGRGGNQYSEAAIIVKVEIDYQVPTQEFENKAVIITRNTDNINNYDRNNPRNPNGLPKTNNVDYMYTVDDPNKLHGPVVNIAELTNRKLESSDWITINNYNLSLDKFVYGYDEIIMDQNNQKRLTDEEGQSGPDNIISGTYSSQKTPDFSRENRNTQTEDRTDLLFNNGMKDTVRVSEEKAAENMEEKKKNNPLSVEKNEKIVYELRLVNEATDVTNNVTNTADKKATAVWAKTITDYMQSGLTFRGVKAIEIHDKDDNVEKKLGVTSDISYSTASQSRNGHQFSKITFTLKDTTLLKPGQSLVIRLNVDIDESNMYLYSLENTAEFTQIKNINNKDIKNEYNLSKHQKSSEYVRMKDLVIAGKVWLDFNKDGLMNDKITDYLSNNAGESSYLSMLQDITTRQQKLKQYYTINDDAMMENIIVKLYVSSDTSNRANGVLVRTTKTDSEGLYTFARDENLQYYTTHYNNYDSGYKFDRNKKYQLVDKAINPDGTSLKDEFGNYPQGTQYANYYVEFEYDGVVYRSTAEYAGTKNLFQDGSYKTEYEIDSNAKEFKEVREKFNENYEYITYNKAYDINGNEPKNTGRLDAYATANMQSKNTSNLEFDKTGHTSQLLVNNDRVMLARSFLEGADGQEKTKYIPLYKFRESENKLPHTEYLKFVNLGLELREDVDLSLTKDVYKVKTTIKGQDMEYNFNKNFIINGETLSESKVNNYMLDKPYGIELYESDYKYRKDQYASIKAVEDYLGETSELNVEVTYRIRVDNNKTADDADMNAGGLNINTPLFVKVDELVDLYDENFIEYTEEMENGAKEDFIKVREIDENTGRFKKEDKKIKVAEAWYYAPDNSGNYVLDETTGLYVDTSEGTVTNAGQKYKLVPLVISNNSKKTSLNEYVGAKGYAEDGYHKLYIRPRNEQEAVVIEEGGHYDFFVKYVLEKNFEEETTITNENFEETKTSETTSTSGTEVSTGDNGSITVDWYKSSQTTTTISNNSKVTIDRSLILKDHRADNPMKQKYGLDTENIAQVNMYSVWYDKEAKKPTSIVDRDSNAGNIGMSDTINKKVDSADNRAIYEDTIYKTGIRITAKGTANLPPSSITEIYAEDDQGSITLNPNIIRSINGHVWDDSRSEKIQEQFIGNGLRNNGTAQNEAKKNELVPITLNGKTEENDIDVPSAKVEFIEIIETDENVYYEMVPSDVMCKYQQHIRTDDNGKYELYGYAPGKYIVRFTYGDDIEESIKNGISEQTIDGKTAVKEHMYLFNGQDYKSAKYTMPEITDPKNPTTSKTGKVVDDNIILYNKEENENNINKVIASLEEANFNDARDDEIRRLEVNGYSEIMDNMVAEILQGMANGTKNANGDYVTNNKDTNTNSEIKALVDNTWMFAETIPFTVRAEKIDEEMRATIQQLLSDVTYASREQLENQLTYTREFKIENVDFGIEYRPENSVQLEKDIKEVKITTESGEEVVDLHFYTEYYDHETDGTVKRHFLDPEKSVGMDMIQFISNDYEVNDLISKLISEREDQLQGFVYINYDTDIQQGATIEVTYEFTAENHGEVDRISKNLDDIRYQNNYKTQTPELVGAITQNIVTKAENKNGVTNYRANLTAANDMIDKLFKYDANGDLYRNSPKVLTKTDGTRISNDSSGANGASRNMLSYYGYYVGYEYYTGEITDFDIVAQLKFNKILDYVDKDMLYLDSTTGKDTVNKTWSVLNNAYGEYYSTIDWARADKGYVAGMSEKNEATKDNPFTEKDVEDYVNSKIKGLDISSIYTKIGNMNGNENPDNLEGNLTFNIKLLEGISGASIDPDGYIYDNMLLSTDTGMYTDRYKNENRELLGAGEMPDGTNPSLSRFLVPMTADVDKDEYSASRGKIDLVVSKAISAETNDDELEYENIAEIVEFTTLTGRRTNFAITIGNVDVRKIPTDPTDPTKPPVDPDDPSPDEYPQSTPEPDQSATEVITLIPPQGLMRRDRVIRDVVEIAKKGTGIVGIVVAVVVIVTFVIMFAIRKYKKRRIK